MWPPAAGGRGGGGRGAEERCGLPPQAVVRGRVGVDERRPHLAARQAALGLVRAHARVVQQGDDLLIAADHVGAVGLAGDRGLAQLGEQRVRVVAVLLREDLVHQRRFAHATLSSVSLRCTRISVGEWPGPITLGRLVRADGGGKSAWTGSSPVAWSTLLRSGGNGAAVSISRS